MRVQISSRAPVLWRSERQKAEGRRQKVGKLIWKSAGLNHQRQRVRIRPQPPTLRSGVTGNTLGFDPRDSGFDPRLRSLRTWPNGSGARLRNESMRVRVLPSAFF